MEKNYASAKDLITDLAKKSITLIVTGYDMDLIMSVVKANKTNPKVWFDLTRLATKVQGAVGNTAPSYAVDVKLLPKGMKIAYGQVYNMAEVVVQSLKYAQSFMAGKTFAKGNDVPILVTLLWIDEEAKPGVGKSVAKKELLISKLKAAFGTDEELKKGFQLHELLFSPDAKSSNEPSKRQQTTDGKGEAHEKAN